MVVKNTNTFKGSSKSSRAGQGQGCAEERTEFFNEIDGNRTEGADTVCIPRDNFEMASTPKTSHRPFYPQCTIQHEEDRDLNNAIPNHQEITRLVVVSNRLPVVVKSDTNGKWNARPASGGLVSALAPVLSRRGGMWVGWSGSTDPQALSNVKEISEDYTLKPVELTEEEIQKYYYGFSNETLWPLFHDLLGRCNFDPDHWKTYQRVNQKFASVVGASTAPSDFIWIHDYHLILVAKYLREVGISRKAVFFLHIPFPPLDILAKLPWRFEILYAMLEYELVGFQTLRDLRHFVRCIRSLIPRIAIKGSRRGSTVTLDGREIHLGVFPIGIDFRHFESEAKSQAVAERAWHIHHDYPDQKLILGLDRLDYTKGIPHRLRAFGEALKRYPELHRRLTMIQVVVPSREEVYEYSRLRKEVERLVGEINGRYTQPGWVPVHYQYRSLSKVDLVAYYRTSEIAFVTPLKDGMNLVAKEYCASSLENGVLILSEFAGAAAQFHVSALLVNPYDIEGMAEALHDAFVMGEQDQQQRMAKLRRSVARQSVFWWVDSFLRAAIAKDLSHFPQVDHYLPHPDEKLETYKSKPMNSDHIQLLDNDRTKSAVEFFSILSKTGQQVIEGHTSKAASD